jgi:hypothetical protein
MQSIFGALLAAATRRPSRPAIAASPNAQKVSNSVEAQLTKSFAGAEAIAQQYPKYADQITAGGEGIVPVWRSVGVHRGHRGRRSGAALVFFAFPRRRTSGGSWPSTKARTSSSHPHRA